MAVIDNDSFVKEVKQRVGSEYTFLEPYIASLVKIKVRHNKCNNEYEVTPNKFLSLNRRCPYCSGRMKKTTEQFKKEVSFTTNGEYELCSEYKNNKTKVQIKHITCGNIYPVTPNDFLSGDRCPECRKKIRSIEKTKPVDQFSNEVDSLTNKEYKVIGEYVSSKTKIEMLHVKCNRTYMVTPNEFLNGNRCPLCYLDHYSSSGATEVYNYLQSRNIEVVREAKFVGCKLKKQLRVDFFLPNEGIAFEFDGEQHIGTTMFSESTDIIRQRDEAKDLFFSNCPVQLVRLQHDQNYLSVVAKILDEGSTTSKSCNKAYTRSEILVEMGDNLFDFK